MAATDIIRKQITVGVFRAKVRLLGAVQRIFGRFGYHVSKASKDVDASDPMGEQLRLAAELGGTVNVIVEVGAADGRDCLTYARLSPGAHIYAYEPLPKNYAALAQKAAGEPRLTAINAAVCDAEGEAEFYETALADASSLLKPNETGSTFDKYTRLSGITHKVRTVTLDQDCAARGIARINLLKMDCQGAEMSVFHGAASLLARKAIDVIYVEVNFQEIYANAPLFHEVAAHLYGHGYHLHNLYGVVSNQNGRISWADAIFTARP